MMIQGRTSSHPFHSNCALKISKGTMRSKVVIGRERAGELGDRAHREDGAVESKARFIAAELRDALVRNAARRALNVALAVFGEPMRFGHEGPRLFGTVGRDDLV